MNGTINSHNPASIRSSGKNINFHSHIYPSNIIYAKSEIIIPINAYIYSFEYSNLNYGQFQDGSSGYLFNASEFLFKGSVKTQIFNKISIGGSIGYTINKISSECFELK